MTHLPILRDGVDRWNEWRVRNPSTRPVLQDVNLRGVVLRGVNLRDANLSGADVRDAHFRKADLSHAILSGAILNRTLFSGTNLRNVTLSRARLYETVFADVDLSGAAGLDDCDHRGPSVIDHRTLGRSGELPISFLRGCGLPEELIHRAGAGQEHYSCFMSYSSMDSRFAAALLGDLQRRGVRCWFAPEDLKTGEKLRPAIDNGIRSQQKVLLILSERSIASPWVEKEVESAFEEERTRGETVLFPIRIDDAVLVANLGWAADIRRTRHIGDFRDWANPGQYRAAFDRLLRDLRVDRGR